MANTKNSVEVQSHLSGVDYPASRQDLVEEAENQDAGNEAIQALQNMPDKQYNSPTDVTHELKEV